MYQVSMIISLILLVYAFIKKDSKKTFWLLMIWMFILFAFNYMNADYAMYQRQYIKYGTSDQFYSSEFLWQLLCKIFYGLHVPYSVFICLYSIFPIVAVGILVNSLSKHKAIALSCFFVFPFLIEVVQIRDFMAIMIISLGLRGLYLNKKNSTFKYMLCCLIAGGFHYISLFYLLLIFVKKMDLRRLAFFILPISIFLILLSEMGLVTKIIEFIIPTEKFNAYFLSGEWQVSHAIAFLSIALQFIIIISLFITYMKHKKRNNQESLENIDLLSFMLKCNLLLLIAVPLYFYTFEFTRIFRGLLLLDYIAITNTLDKNLTYDNLSIRTLTIMLVATLFFVLVIYVNIYHKTVVSIFTYNHLLEWISTFLGNGG